MVDILLENFGLNCGNSHDRTKVNEALWAAAGLMDGLLS